MSSSRAREENVSAITVDERATSRGIECAHRVLNAMFLDTSLFAVPKGKEKKGDTSKNKSFRGQQKQYGRQKQGSTNQVDENGYSSESSEDGLAFSVTEGVHAVSDELMVPVGINGIVKDILIDSGSVSNLISLNEYE